MVLAPKTEQTEDREAELPNGIKNRTLFIGDNLDVLRGFNSRCIDLIYLDPPFNSNKNYKAPMASMAQGAAFDDMWTPDSFREEWLVELERDNPELYHVIKGATGAVDAGTGAYLCYMAKRLLELRRVLKPSGTIYLHCDDAAVHYLKAVMDAIFDAGRYMGTIVWKRTSAHNDSKSWGRVADYLLCYGKQRLNVNDIRVGLNPEYLKTKYRYNDENGRYRLDNLTAKGLSGGGYTYLYHGHEGPWRFPPERMLQLEADGRIVIGKKTAKRPLPVPQLKRYLSPDSGQAPGNVWVDIRPVNSQAHERTQWKTQKPEALLRRIVLASSRPAEYDADGNVIREADWVLDPFCGCATACVVAEDLGRNWIGIDLEDQAESVLRDRLLVREKRHYTQAVLSEYRGAVYVRKTPAKRTDDEDEETIHPDFNDFLYELQEHRCNGCGRELDIIDMQSDHIEPSSKGGEKYTERNRNLLCARCNQKKSNKHSLTVLRDLLREEGLIAYDMRLLDPKRGPAFAARREELRRRRMNKGID